MGLSYPLALALLVSLPVAWWLYRRNAAHDEASHPLWFLVPAGERPRASQPKRTSLSIVLWLVALTSLALIAAGPVLTGKHSRRGVVIDLSMAMEGQGIADAKRRLRAAGEDTVVVLVAPRSTTRVDVAQALARLDGEQPLSAGSVSPARVRAGVALARKFGATDIDIVRAPAVERDVGIVGARFVPSRFGPRAGSFVVELARIGPAAPSVQVSATGRQPLWTESITIRHDHAVLEVPYVGLGADLVEIQLRVDKTDAVSANNRAVIEVPSLARTSVYVEPDVRGSPVARALAVLPSVALVSAPGDRAVVVSRHADTTTVGRAILAVDSSTGANAQPLLPVPGSPLPGLTPRLLSEHDPISVTERSVASDRVWLRAGPQPAIYADDAGGRQVVHIAAGVVGPVLAVALVDLFATQPLRIAPMCRVEHGGDRAPGHHESAGGCSIVTAAAIVNPSASTAAPANISQPPAHSFALLNGLFVVVLLMLLAEALVSRPDWSGIAARLGVGLIVLGGFGGAKTPEYRRVVFVVDTSASMGDLSGVRAAVSAEAKQLGKHDRAAVVVVAGGAATVVPLGSASAVRGWAAKPWRVPAGIDRERTDLAHGFRAAAEILGNAPGQIVLVGDGNDTERGAAVMDSPSLAGHGVRFVAVDRGDTARIASIPVGLRARAGAELTVPVTIETTQPGKGTLELFVGTNRLAKRPLNLGEGATTVSVAATLNASGRQRLRALLRVEGDRFQGNNEVTAFVEVRGKTKLLVVAGDAANLPDDPLELSRYDVIVVDNVAYASIGDARARRVAAFVRAGGTLLLSGSMAGFAKGGYTGSVLDRISPLRSEPRSTDEGAAVVMVLDRSGSVARATDAPNLPGAGQLSALADRLGDNDVFGVIAFDVAAHPVRPLTPASDRGQSARLPLPHGGTNPVGALRMAKRWLQSAGEKRRIVVLVSDGGFPRYYAQTRLAAGQLAAIGARLIVLSIGRTSPARDKALRAIARAGNGFAIVGRRLTDAVPALRVRPRSASSGSQVIAARVALRALLSPAAVRAFRKRRLATYVLTGLARDATLLADVGAHPLLAVRPHGGGHVFALATNLQPGFTQLTSELRTFAARTRQRSAGIHVAPGPTPREVLISVSHKKTANRPVLSLNGDLRTKRTMRYRGGNTYELVVALAGDATISVDGIGNVGVASRRVERAPLATLHVGKHTTHTSSPIVRARVSAWLSLFVAIAIGLILVLVGRNRAKKNRQKNGSRVSVVT